MKLILCLMLAVALTLGLTPLVRQLAIRVGAMDPVSYTHLDVYKRQG